MALVAIVLGLGLFVGYVAAGIYGAKALWTSLAAKAQWIRVMISSFALAVFFAPVFVGAGHGAGLEPAWFALIDPGSNRFAIKHAVISLTVTWASLFIIGVVTFGTRKRRNK